MAARDDAGGGTGSARRQRERRLRACLEYARMSVAMALAESQHHSAQRQRRARAREEELEVHCTAAFRGVCSSSRAGALRPLRGARLSRSLGRRVGAAAHRGAARRRQGKSSGPCTQVQGPGDSRHGGGVTLNQGPNHHRWVRLRWGHFLEVETQVEVQFLPGLDSGRHSCDYARPGHLVGAWVLPEECWFGFLRLLLCFRVQCHAWFDSGYLLFCRFTVASWDAWLDSGFNTCVSLGRSCFCST